MGYEKLVQKRDERMAAENGLMFRPDTTGAIEKHLGDFGVEPEDASHTLIKSLSGGQKIKVAQPPHHRAGRAHQLQGPRLARRPGVAINEYKGGVVIVIIIIISHNREFAGAVCQEKRIMDGGELRREGESIAQHEDEQKPEELGGKVVIDAMGNEVRVEKTRGRSRRRSRG
jgi:elongation factor 3